MNIDSKKGRNPELLTDWNGHAVQCFPLGGDTLEVAAATTFIPKSSLIRVANISSTTISYLRKSSLPAEDVGTPILCNSAEMFSVVPGEVYEVLTTKVFVTFIRNRDV